MRGKVRLLGKTIPAWVIAVALIVGTAGAATGVVLSGGVSGTATITASQSLLVSGGAIPDADADASLVTVADDGTGFHAAAEVNTGDDFRVYLALANESDQALSGELTLIAPDGITLDADGADDIVDDVVQTGPFTWNFRLPPTNDSATDLKIKVALADDMPPGFYAVDGSLKQTAK